MTGATRKQAAVLKFIREYIDANGYSPTVREIAGKFGYSTTNSAAQHLAALRAKGLITWTPHLARTLRPVEVCDG